MREKPPRSLRPEEAPGSVPAFHSIPWPFPIGGFPWRFILSLLPENRPICNVELIACLQMAPSCGPVYADGIEGDYYRIEITAFREPVRFHDRESAQNAIRHLQKDQDVQESDFEILPCEE